MLRKAAFLLLAVAAAYSGSFGVPFLFDDIPSILRNPTIRFLSSSWHPPADTTASGRPVLNFSLAINEAISGREVWSYHALNLAIHILSCLALFGIVRLVAERLSIRRAPLIAMSTALLWALHPLQTESVTYVVQRAESLMGLFYLLTLYCFIRGAEAAGRRPLFWFGLSWMACVLGMGTKEVMVSAPVIVLLFDRTFLAGSFREAWRRRWRVHSGLAATWLLLEFLVISTHGRSGTAGFESGASARRYWLAQIPAIARYLRLSFWPHPLVFDYGVERADRLAAILPSAALAAGLIAASLWAFSRKEFRPRLLGFAGLFFFAILAPTSLVPGIRQTAAEHRMYLALIPVVVVTVAAAYRWAGLAAFPICLAVAAVLSVLTWERNEDYRSALALWSRTVAEIPSNAYARNNLGCELAAVPGRSGEAIAEFAEALRLKPDYPEAHNNLGGVYLKSPGRSADAAREFGEALRLRPDYPEAHNNLGNALENEPGRLDDAIAQYEQALKANPGFAEAHCNLGSALLRKAARAGDAGVQFEEALRLDPNSAEAHNGLGCALEQLPGRLGDAVLEHREALRLRPDYAEAHYDLGNALEAWGRPEQAVDEYREALRLRPDYAEAHANLGCALETLPGRLPDAIAEYETALRMNPGIPEVRGYLQNARRKLAK